VTTDQVLDVRGLKRHFGGVTAVDGITLTVGQGDVVAVIGQNGSGKTTLINVITGFFQPTSGQVSLRGREITGYPMSRIARLGVARTFQNLRLFEELTGLDNVMAGMLGRTRIGFWKSVASPLRHGRQRAARERARQTLELLGVGHCAQVKVKNLAHGDRRRIELARAFVVHPDLLILDEPSAGLTGDETDDLVTALSGLRQGASSMLLIEHNLSVVERLADHVLVMHSGKSIAAGRLSDVLAEPSVRALYLGLADA
jgi:ABC-type branched-subunit amino acid transport system ATPase component